MEPNDKLTKALETQNIDMLIELKKKGYDLSQIYISEYISTIDIEVLYFLLENGVDVNTKGEKGLLSSLDIATLMKNSNIVKLLLEYNAEINWAIYADNVESVKFLLDNGADINVKDKSNKSILEYAYEKINKEVIELLIENNVDLNTPFSKGDNALRISIIMDPDNELVEDIIGKMAEKINIDRATAKEKMIAISSIEFIDNLVQNGIDINTRTEYDQTALSLATITENTNIIKYLIDNGADINAQTEHGQTALLLAIINKKNVVEFLIDCGADINIEDNNGMTALMYMIGNDDIANVKLLIQHGVDINMRDKNGNTPLIGASEFGNKEIVELLIKNGADIIATNTNRITALERAVADDHLKIIKLLLENGADVKHTVDGANLLMLAAGTNASKDIVKFLLSKGIDINAQDRSGTTALMYAVKNNRMKIIKYLIKKGADVNIGDEKNDTVLSFSIIHASVEIVQYLIKQGANTNVTDKNGNNLINQVIPIYLISDDKYLELLKNEKDIDLYKQNMMKILKIFIKNGVNLDDENSDQATPLMAATMFRDRELIKILINHGADINHKNNAGYNALLMSIYPLKMMQYMFKNIDLLNNINHDNIKQTILDSMLDKFNVQNSLNITKFLVKKGAIIEKMPVYMAMMLGNIELFQYLLSCKNKISYKDLFFMTLIFSVADTEKVFSSMVPSIQEKEIWASMLQDASPQTYIKILKILLKKDIDLDKKKDGYSALAYAVIFDSLDVVELLINHGADINKKSKTGYLPIEYAVVNKSNRMRTFLLKKGAILPEQIEKKKITKEIHNIFKELDDVADGSKLIDDAPWLKKGTKLSQAIQSKNIEALKDAIRTGANLNVLNVTELLHFGHNAKFIDILLKNGANKNSQDEKGKTALMHACELGKTKIVKVFIKNGVDIDIVDNKGNDVWYYASLSGKEAIFELLRNYDELSAPNHNPKELVEILTNFTKDTPIKYTTHNWDFGKISKTEHKSFQGFKDAIRKQWNKLEDDLYELSPNLHKKIYTFLLNDNKEADSWCEKADISIGWSSLEGLKKWCNDGKDPYKFKLDTPYIVDNKEISTFEDVINLFKQEIENRKEHHMLKKYFIDIKKSLDEHFTITFENFREDKFYTDIEKFKLALTNIFSEIKKRDFPQIIVSATNDIEGQYIDISIVQTGSVAQQSSDSMLKEAESGNFQSIKHLLVNLCDWSIESSLNEEHYRINYLRSDKDMPEIEFLDYEPDGFTYKLRFYKA